MDVSAVCLNQRQVKVLVRMSGGFASDIHLKAVPKLTDPRTGMTFSVF